MYTIVDLEAWEVEKEMVLTQNWWLIEICRDGRINRVIDQSEYKVLRHTSLRDKNWITVIEWDKIAVYNPSRKFLLETYVLYEDDRFTTATDDNRYNFVEVLSNEYIKNRP